MDTFIWPPADTSTWPLTSLVALALAVLAGVAVSINWGDHLGSYLWLHEDSRGPILGFVALVLSFVFCLVVAIVLTIAPVDGVLITDHDDLDEYVRDYGQIEKKRHQLQQEKEQRRKRAVRFFWVITIITLAGGIATGVAVFSGS